MNQGTISSAVMRRLFVTFSIIGEGFSGLLPIGCFDWVAICVLEPFEGVYTIRIVFDFRISCTLSHTNEDILSTAISIGNFDAVHKGHIALVRAARSAVGVDGLVEMWSFEPPPVTILRPTEEIHRITTYTERKRLLEQAGADVVHKLEPTERLLNLSPEEFIQQVVSPKSPDFIVEGEGFRFGHQREGSIETLNSLGPKYQFESIEVKPVSVDIEQEGSVRASSSLARRLLSEGRMRDVENVLGRGYSLMGEVVKGDCRGRELGVPTANLGSVETMLPRDGIYAGFAFVDGERFIAAVSVGTKPTFGEHDRTCEVHLIGYDGEIGAYGWTLNVTISQWIREQKAFDSIDSLTIAIRNDIQSAIKIIESST